MKDVYKFKDYVYEGAYAPFYDKYKGHKFVIDHTMKEDPSGEHVWIVCVSDIDVEVDGYIHLYDLEIVDIDLEKILADVLQQEIWKEITAETGETKADYDNKIIEAIMSIKDELDTNKEAKS